MARGRFLSNSISDSQDMARLYALIDERMGPPHGANAVIVVTWAISHLDIEGRMNGAPKVVAGKVVSLLPIDAGACAEYLRAAAQLGIVDWYDAGGCVYLSFPKFREHQKGLRAEKEAPSKIPALSAGRRLVEPWPGGVDPRQRQLALASPALLLSDSSTAPPAPDSAVAAAGEEAGVGGDEPTFPTPVSVPAIRPASQPVAPTVGGTPQENRIEVNNSPPRAIPVVAGTAWGPSGFRAVWADVTCNTARLDDPTAECGADMCCRSASGVSAVTDVRDHARALVAAFVQIERLYRDAYAAGQIDYSPPSRTVEAFLGLGGKSSRWFAEAEEIVRSGRMPVFAPVRGAGASVMHPDSARRLQDEFVARD